jgi:hypothetical protein
MALYTNNPDQYAKAWFYITLGIVSLYGVVVFAFIFPY